MEFFEKLFSEQKIYFVPGSEFSCVRYGWFRIIFAIDRDALSVTMERLVQGLTNK